MSRKECEEFMCRCPKCGSKDIIQGEECGTCIGHWGDIDPNLYSSHCTCDSCGLDFSFTHQQKHLDGKTALSYELDGVFKYTTDKNEQ